MTDVDRGERESVESPGAATLLGLPLVPGTRHKLGDQLYHQLHDHIIDGHLKEGERLPSENEISALFGVSRPIVRTALLRLRLEGLLHARQGSGTYVSRQATPKQRVLPAPDQVATFLRCFEVRLPVEAAAARLAASRRTPEQLAAIEAAHDEYRRGMEAGEPLHGSDLAFHLAIAEASGNPQFADVLRFIEDPVTGSRSLSVALARTQSRDQKQQIWAEHGHVVQAIRSGEGEAAQVAMQFHINQMCRRLLSESRSPTGK